MNKQIEKVRTHLSENKVTYIACGVTAVVVAGVTYYFCGKSSPVSVTPRQIMTWKSTQTIEVYVEALGDPGNIIQDLTTGTIYASQGQAAKALDIHPSRISECLKGTRDHVNGHRFTKLGKAMVPDAA